MFNLIKRYTDKGLSIEISLEGVANANPGAVLCTAIIKRDGSLLKQLTNYTDYDRFIEQLEQDIDCVTGIY